MNLALVFCGCQSSEIRLSEDDERFAALYADVLLVQADYERVNTSGGIFSKSDSLQKLFSVHRFSSEQFNTLFSRYNADPARWLKVQERALSLLGKHRDLNAQAIRSQSSSPFNLKEKE